MILREIGYNVQGVLGAVGRPDRAQHMLVVVRDLVKAGDVYVVSGCRAIVYCPPSHPDGLPRRRVTHLCRHLSKTSLASAEGWDAAPAGFLHS